jgi:hypothetical protein
MYSLYATSLDSAHDDCDDDDDENDKRIRYAKTGLISDARHKVKKREKKRKKDGCALARVIVVHSISLIIKSEKTPEEISPERNWAK